jgi:hypothetical protein
MSILLGFAMLFFAGPAVTPEDLDTSLNKLKEAVVKKDVAEVKKLAKETSDMARQIAAAPLPEDPVEKKAQTDLAAHAKDVDVYTEYALYATGVQAEPATTIDLLSMLEQQNPKSQYLDAAYPRYIYALHQTGGAAKIVPLAQKAIGNFPENEDLLLVLADNAMTRKQTDRALGFAERLQAAAKKHGKPEGMAAAEWEKKRNLTLGRGYWIAGMMHCEKTQFYEADKDLRAALPLIQGNDAMVAPTLFYLGVANYQLGSAALNKAQVLEAAKFSEQASKMNTPLANQAWRNSLAMRDAALKLR